MKQDYKQPAFYRFNEDSTDLIRYIGNLGLSENLNFLDIGSGCGIIGIELARINSTWSGTLLEPQKEFRPYIEENRALFKAEHLEVEMCTLENFKSEAKFDLIVFNPPYFFDDNGRAPSNENRRKCRHIKQEEFENWFSVIPKLLSSKGRVIFCFRKNDSWEKNFKPKELNYIELNRGLSVDIHDLGILD